MTRASYSSSERDLARPSSATGTDRQRGHAATTSGQLFLDGVARNQLEVEYDDLRGLAQPLTQRTTIQAKNAPSGHLRIVAEYD